MTRLPTEADHFKGRYALWLGTIPLCLGLITTAITLWLMLLNGSFSSTVVLGLLLILIGFLYLTRPYFAVAPNRLTIYNLLGKSVKRYPLASFSHIVVENSSVYIKSDYATAAEQNEKVDISKQLMRSQDWQHLKAIATER